MPNIEGHLLKEARKRKVWTQDDLSENSRPRVTVSTISRIEQGKVKHVRKNTLMALAETLGVRPDELSRAPEGERDVMKIRMDAAARNALMLVARRYRVSRDAILGVAPLLFHIAAERSLKQRRERLDAVGAAENALIEAYQMMPHVPMAAPVDEDAIRAEKRSIEARDLFGSDFDDSTQNPFSDFLRSELTEIGASEDAVDSVSWYLSLGSRYRICEEEAATIVGNDATATHAILCGAAAFHEMPKGSPQQRAEWARHEFERKYGELNRWLSDQLSDLGKPSGTDTPSAHPEEPTS